MPATNYPHDSPSLRKPASKRVSLPASQRLSTVTEGAVTRAPTSAQWSIPRSSTSTAATCRTAPPPYELVPPPVRRDIPNPHDEEKLGRLRRTLSATERRGGWGRLALLIAALLGVVGLAVGLGVGLTKGKKKDSNGAGEGNATYSQQQPENSTPTQQLPLGQYSFATSLRAQTSNCTSDPATWRCYPYTVLDPPTRAQTPPLNRRSTGSSGTTPPSTQRKTPLPRLQQAASPPTSPSAAPTTLSP